MRFIKTYKNTSGKKVFEFVIGETEVMILKDITDFIYKAIPQSFFTAPIRTRIRNIKNVLGKIVAENGMKEKYQRTNGFNPDDLEETL